MGQYERHVFVCTSGSVCPTQGSDLVYAALKKGAAAAGVQARVRVNHAGCMGQCGNGPMVVVYPENVWYAHVDVPGAEQILNDHLIGNQVVEGYRYVAPPGDNKLPK